MTTPTEAHSSSTESQSNARSGSKPSRSVLAAALAALDVVLAAVAGKLFGSIAWKIAVVALGLIVVLLTVVDVRAASGQPAVNWKRVRRVVAGRIFWAFSAALIAVVITVGVFQTFDLRPFRSSSTSPSASPIAAASEAGSVRPSQASSAAASGAPAICDLMTGRPGVVAVSATSLVPPELTFCPVLLNNGAAITGAFNVAGKIIGPFALYKDLVIVNQADQETCDALGNPPVTGTFYARGMVINNDGSWSFRDALGYDEAVTIARTYEFVSASPASIETIKNDRANWLSTHKNSNDYAGMAALPADAKVLATFRQPPGKYKGKGSPCKNS
jgi:hypothetical protein